MRNIVISSSSTFELLTSVFESCFLYRTSTFPSDWPSDLNTNGLRDYAANALPIEYMADSKTGGLNAQSVAQDFERFSKQSNNPDSKDLSMGDIQAILENRLAVTDRASSETIEVLNKQ